MPVYAYNIINGGRMKQKICVIKADGIGDAVLASPFFYELRRLHPNSEITAFLSPLGAPVLSEPGLIDRIIIFDPLWLKYKKTFFLRRWISALTLVFKINAVKPDILIGLRWQDRLTSLVLSLSNAKDKYGYDTKGMGFGINHKLPPPVPGMAEYLKHLTVLKQITKSAKLKPRFVVFVSSGAEKRVSLLTARYKKRGYIVIQPVSGHPSKDWERSKFRELCVKIGGKTPVFVVGAALDKGIERLIGSGIHNLSGKLTIEETAALIKHAKLFIGNDSFGGHMAAAFGVKSLTLFSGTAPVSEWAPYGKKADVLVSEASCAPCGKANCDQERHKCMDFTVNEVYERVIKTLKR